MIDFTKTPGGNQGSSGPGGPGGAAPGGQPPWTQPITNHQVGGAGPALPSNPWMPETTGLAPTRPVPPTISPYSTPGPPTAPYPGGTPPGIGLPGPSVYGTQPGYQQPQQDPGMHNWVHPGQQNMNYGVPQMPPQGIPYGQPQWPMPGNNPFADLFGYPGMQNQYPGMQNPFLNQFGPIPGMFPGGY